MPGMLCRHTPAVNRHVDHGTWTAAGSVLAQPTLSGQQAGGDERALLQLLAAHRIAPGAEVDGGLLGGLLQRPNLIKVVTTQASVIAVAYSPDGRHIAWGGGDSTLHLWDAKTVQPIGVSFGKHEGGIASVAYSPDGGRIASGSSKGTLRLWNANTGQPIVEPVPGHKGWVTRITFSPDSSRIVSIDNYDGTPRLWDGHTGRVLGEPHQA